MSGNIKQWGISWRWTLCQHEHIIHWSLLETKEKGQHHEWWNIGQKLVPVKIAENYLKSP